MTSAPLLELFYTLRDEKKFPLSLEQYFTFYDYLCRGLATNRIQIDDQSKIKQICQALWVKSPEQKQVFNLAWETMRQGEQNLAEDIVKSLDRLQTVENLTPSYSVNLPPSVSEKIPPAPPLPPPTPARKNKPDTLDIPAALKTCYQIAK